MQMYLEHRYADYSAIHYVEEVGCQITDNSCDNADVGLASRSVPVQYQ